MSPCPITHRAWSRAGWHLAWPILAGRMREPKVYKPKLTRLGPHVVYNAQRCIMCTRCVRFMDEVAHERQLGVMNRGDHSEIGVFPGQPLDSAYSLNTVDVCPVGALTSTAFRFKQRVWFTKPVNAHRDCQHEKCGGRVTLWYKGKDVLRVTARKDEYNEVKEWICNECRFEKKETADWVIEGPAHIDRSSVISANHYELPVLNASVIADLPESSVRDLEQNPPLKLGGFSS